MRDQLRQQVIDAGPISFAATYHLAGPERSPAHAVLTSRACAG